MGHLHNGILFSLLKRKGRGVVCNMVESGGFASLAK
jgi:hypothetical protein